MLSGDFVADTPFNCPSDYFCRSVWKCRSHCTDKSRCTFFIRYSFQTVKQHIIFDIIRCIHPRIACRINSRLLVQVINLQTRIICKHNTVAGNFCNLRRLDQCIFFKRASIFHNIHINTSFFHRLDWHSKVRKDHADLFHFILITCCKYNLWFHIRFPPLFLLFWWFRSQKLIKIRLQHSIVNLSVLVRFSAKILFCILIACNHICRPAVQVAEAVTKLSI